MIPRPYLSYLLRLRGEVSQGQVIWRASLESVQSGEHREFASVEQLFAYLRADLQTERPKAAAVITATIQAGKVDELCLLWHTSLASALTTMLGLSYISLLADRVNHGFLVIAHYAARPTVTERWDAGQWQTLFVLLTSMLQLDSICYTLYEVVGAGDTWLCR